MVVRVLTVLVAGAILAFLAIGSAVVARFAATDPRTAARIWSGHPDVLVNRALVGIARAAAAGEDPDPASLEMAMEAALKAPLQAEPFLVRGAEAQVAGRQRLAEQAFLEARRRNPRADAARFFLAEHYLRSGRVGQGLEELLALAQLAPAGQNLIPLLAQFARAEGSVEHMRRLFARHPRLEPYVLQHLAAVGADTGRILELASSNAYRPPQRDKWLPALLNTLVERGDVARALELWRQAAGTRAGEGLFDPQFRGLDAPPPFNWSFASAGAGFAEPTGDGGLRVLYYGRENAVLAHQLLLLDPGAYRLAMRVRGPNESSGVLAWRIVCVPGGQKLLDLSLGDGQSDRLAAGFRVPDSTDCRAQRLELAGTSPEFARQADVTISDLQLSEAGR